MSQSTGAWLYEISVYGVFLDEPWALQTLSPYWTAQTVSFTAAATISFATSFNLSVVTINNAAAAIGMYACVYGIVILCIEAFIY